jgi:predicted GNAT family acetyltransferase
MTDVRDNTTLNRFELDLDGHTAFATYRQQDGVVTFLHTETPPELRGRGAASKLIQGALEIVRAEGSKVRALCPFVASYVARHPEAAELAP